MRADPPVENSGDRRPASRLIGPVCLALAGAALALTPHAMNGWAHGDVTYIADGDQLLYSAWSRAAALHGSWRLSDGVHPVSGPMMHPWLLFVPVAGLAHAVGADVRGLAVVWRGLGGAGVAVGLYAALRPFVRDRRTAVGLAAVLLFDAGFLFGQPVLRQLDVLASLANGSDRYFDGPPRLLGHLRVVPPSLVLPFLLGMQGLVARARLTDARRDWVGAGVLLGLLFYLYLYFWTAAVGALVVAFAVDPKGRRGYATVLAVGLALGFPALVHGAWVKAGTPADWLSRTEKFVPVGRFDDWLLPKVMTAVWALVAPVVFTRRRELTYLWCTVGAGLACANHRLVTGLEVENFHWLLPAGVSFSVLAAVLVGVRLVEPGEGDVRRPRFKLLAAWVLAQAALGVYLRGVEATRSAETRRWMAAYQQDRADAPPVPPGAVLAGEPDPVMLRAALGDEYALAGKLVEYCSGVTDAELDERLILNLYLRGLTRPEAEALVAQPPGTLSWESLAVHSEPVALAQRARRLDLIERIWADPARYVARYGVTHVLLGADAPGPPAAVGPWTSLSRGRFLRLWGLTPATAAFSAGRPRIH